MAVVDETIDVEVPLRAAYNQWTQFEDFPRFMEGVEHVHQLNETTLEWHAKVAGIEKSWRARIVEQVPDQRVRWISTSRVRNDGTVSFSSLGPDRTRVNLLLEVEPESAAERVGTALGILHNRVEGDLERFRDFIEARGTEPDSERGDFCSGIETTSSTGGRGRTTP